MEKFPWVSLRKIAETRVSASGCRMSGGHLRMPLAATRVAARGCKWLPVTRECWRPLAATRVAASGCKWLPVTSECLATTRVAASGCKWLPVTRECWRPLAATCGHSSGCKWLPFPKSNYAPAACSMHDTLFSDPAAVFTKEFGHSHALLGQTHCTVIRCSRWKQILLLVEIKTSATGADKWQPFSNWSRSRISEGKIINDSRKVGLQEDSFLYPKIIFDFRSDLKIKYNQI